MSIGAFAADTPDSYGAARQFPAMIVEALARYELKQQVVAGPRRPGALHVDGTIERYRESNGLFRYVGLGARFDATVRLSDGASGAVFGAMRVNRDSSPLGGVQAIVEDGDYHLRKAAVRVADEVVLSLGVEPFWLREGACIRGRCARPGYRSTR